MKKKHHFIVVVVQSPSCVWYFVTPWTVACQSSLSITISQSLLKFMSIESVMPSSHLILHRPFFLLPSIFPSIRVFSNESTLHISFSTSPSKEYSGLISFRIDWFDLLAVPGTLKSLLQHHKSEGISSLALSLHCPNLTSAHDYWKDPWLYEPLEAKWCFCFLTHC